MTTPQPLPVPTTHTAYHQPQAIHNALDIEDAEICQRTSASISRIVLVYKKVDTKSRLSVREG